MAQILWRVLMHKIISVSITLNLLVLSEARGGANGERLLIVQYRRAHFTPTYMQVRTIGGYGKSVSFLGEMALRRD
jgi:hypothetical protein